ncbi:DUF1778 domain-containing protein [Caldimonas brevitalea]|uniref:CopG family transcriptional regulator n=1 Tax=Caldimonas brevitalea TaxID=413882 RepID=A0A0G3BP57_9BURK|nr:DUF1778 domain-containing protein [Caldimonas brevitalea]AKJ29151.1 CopG family transcriptional regulator [Caldimonas brevitalea]
MSTTTIHLDDELKRRVANAAEQCGKTVDEFILDAIAQHVAQVEHDDEFHHLADRRWARLTAGGESVAWEQAKAYLEARARGEQPNRPAGRRRVR